MKNKPVVIVSALLFLTVAAFFVVTKMTINNDISDNKQSATSNETVSIAKAKSDAQKLIGETVTQEDVKSKIGEWDNFEMSSEGCERGVYAGRFFYEDFTIFSKTYDKGKTYHIESINEK
ncbi:hypothetical protein [Lagierella sp.]|uniref:hypothetical protein n=1 Tax=Lagierella sp. TaxID=2849657 RepID=UPI0026149F99|nr:hypothetical protein [Lagierella sp.]